VFSLFVNAAHSCAYILDPIAMMLNWSMYVLLTMSGLPNCGLLLNWFVYYILKRVLSQRYPRPLLVSYTRDLPPVTTLGLLFSSLLNGPPFLCSNIHESIFRRLETAETPVTSHQPFTKNKTPA
jgi:hypothetical protein